MCVRACIIIIIIIIIEGLSLLQSIPPTTANKQTQAQKRRGSMARKLLGENIYMRACIISLQKFGGKGKPWQRGRMSA